MFRECDSDMREGIQKAQDLTDVIYEWQVKAPPPPKKAFHGESDREICGLRKKESDLIATNAVIIR